MYRVRHVQRGVLHTPLLNCDVQKIIIIEIRSI
jgi:hypothetical protein